MNLELFNTKNPQPSDSWWDRLFNAHGDIRFDDYDKDFTDLPTPIAEVRSRKSRFSSLWIKAYCNLQGITALEGASNERSRLEDHESKERDNARERDDVRKRNRQVRLAELRGGSYLSWVELDKRNPASNEMMPGQQQQ